MWSADFNDAPNLIDEALAEVHQLKKDSNQQTRRAGIKTQITMTQIRFDCPGCGQTLEMPAEAQFEQVTCPTCQHEFFPDKTRIVPPAPAAPTPPVESAESIIARSEAVFPVAASEKIQRQAESFTAVACLCVIIGVLALLMSLFSETTVVSPLVCGAAFGLALWLYLIAQIIHIRALLAKK